MTVRHLAAGRLRAGALGALALGLAVSGCNANAEDTPRAGGASPSESPSETAPTESAAKISSSIDAGSRAVPVDAALRLDVADGTFSDVVVRAGKERKKLTGELSSDKTSWVATDRFEPGTKYVVRSVAVDSDGLEKTDRSRFRTEPLTLDQQTYPSIAPLQGETVGVGMPVIVKFDIAVTNKKSIERHLHVRNSSGQKGSWYWISDYEAHWRPVHYWKPGTEVTVDADINSVPAGNGIFGQLSRTQTFKVGDSVITRVNVAQHVARTYVNGQLARTIPISGGKPGFETRSGVKVIVEKFRSKRMDAATTGIKKDDPEYYNIEDVEYALRVTYSGEFLHAAPWSEGSQGSANVSHGCVGMSTGNAAWLYHLTKRGDVVDVKGTDRQMTLTNGYGDWNLSFKDYKRGSALH